MVWDHEDNLDRLSARLNESAVFDCRVCAFLTSGSPEGKIQYYIFRCRYFIFTKECGASEPVGSKQLVYSFYPGCWIFIRGNVKPLLGACDMSDLLDSVDNKGVKAPCIVIDVAQDYL